MSAIIPGCDSDEEVFWGPVTARELELIWRSRIANKKGESANPVEKFIKNPEILNKSSDQDMCSKSITNSVQEVPSLHELGSSIDNQVMKFEENDHESQFEENASIGTESTLPLHEASVIINKDHNEIEHVNFPSDIPDKDYISDQGIQESGNFEHEDQVKSEPESLNQFNDSIENPELTENVDLVHDKNTKETSNSENLNEIVKETKQLYQPNIYNDVNDESKECGYPNEKEIKTCGISTTNFNRNDSDGSIVCEMTHTSPEPQKSNSVVIDCVESTSVTSSSDDFESVNLATSEVHSQTSCSKKDPELNQSNIENIPPESLNGNNPENDDVPIGLDVSEKIGSFRKNNASVHRLNDDNVLQELKIENQDISVDCSHNNGDAGASESSDEKSFVSLNGAEDNCISSSNDLHSSSNQDNTDTHLIKDKENEEPSSVPSNQDQDHIKSKIPVSNHVKTAVLKPARLHHTPGTVNEKWLNDLKRKKIPKPKKPEYMVSPAKLGSILKSRNQPTSADKPTASDVKKSTNTKIASYTPQPGSSKILTTPRKKQFEYVKSPISQYIRTGTGIPTAKSLPALQSPNKIPIPITAKKTPVQKLPPKFYLSAKPGSSSSVLKPAENKLFLTPKIFKHQGRVADLKKPGDINVVTPRAVRKTNLTETSFACLPQSSKELEVSVLEEI